MSFVNPTTAIPRPDLAGPLMLHNPKIVGAIGSILLPPMMVDKDTDNFDRVGVAALSKLVSTIRADGNPAKRINWQLENDSYQTIGYGVEDALPDAKRAKRKNINWDEMQASMVGSIMIRDYERIVSGILINETNWPASGNTGVTLGTPWDNASATPATDLAPGIDYLCKVNGVDASQLTLELSGYTARKLAFVTDVRSRLQIYTAPFPGMLTAQQLAFYFGVGEVVIAGGMYNTADEGQTASLSAVWNEDYAFLCIRAKDTSPDLRTPQLGRTIVWPGPYPGLAEMAAAAGMQGSGYGGLPMYLETWRDDNTSSDIFRAGSHYVAKTFGQTFGYLIKNTKT